MDESPTIAEQILKIGMLICFIIKKKGTTIKMLKNVIFIATYPVFYAV